jgi:hypothetical protein
MHERFPGRAAATRPSFPVRTAAIAAALVVPLVPAAAQEAEPRAPGQLQVDPEAAERALERTLTAEGALLLPVGRVEIEPSLRYERTERDEFVGIDVDGDGAIGLGEVGPADIERDEVEAGLDIRVGLPFRTQFELGVPYRFVSSDETANLLGSRQTESNSGSGIGDVTVGLAATLLREEGWRPDVIARATWDTATAKETEGNLLLAESFHEIRGSLTFLKRQDPLAFVGSVFYETAFERDDIDPGDSYGFGLSANLAASPETSLSLGFQQSFSQDLERDGRSIDNSDTTQGVLTLGASSILGDGVLLNVTLGVGLSDDAPDYFVRVGLPIRLGRALF